jgi:16S rRNA (cytosine967-C5)-methyltransferase
MAKNARTVALTVLSACRRKGVWLDVELRERLRFMDTREAALCSWLCYTVVQNRRYLDFVIADRSRLPIAKMHPQVLDCLRLGVGQLWASDSIPPSAAVNETVKLIRKAGHERAAGFANAVLRSLCGSDAWPELPRDPADRYFSLKYNLPVWMVRRFQELLGTEAEAFFQSVNRKMPVTLHFDPLKTNKDELRLALESAGHSVREHSLWRHCLQIESTAGLEEWQIWKEGAVWVADTAAALTVSAAGLQPGMRVLDACAAPGGKTLLLAAALKGTGDITACDIYDHKLEAMRQTVARVGLQNISIIKQDALLFRSDWENQFDVVFCDLPCSGLGVMAKKPDIREKTEESIAAIPDTQKAMLNNLCRYVKPGGKLLYATCTLLPEENEGVAEHFGKHNRAFTPKDFTNGIGRGSQMTLWPHRRDTDGFYFALWEKSV